MAVIENQRNDMVHFKITSLARFAQAGLVYIYLSKLIDTVYHGFYRPAAFAGIIVLLNILAGFAQLIFFIALYKFFMAKNEKKLKTIAGMIAIGASIIALVPKFFALAVLIQHDSLFFIIRRGNLIGALCPWLSSLLMIIFCVIQVVNKNLKRRILFKRAFIAGLIGWAIMFSAHTMVLVNYFLKRQLIGVVNPIDSGLILFVITSTTALICLFFFYQPFTRDSLYHLNQNEY